MVIADLLFGESTRRSRIDQSVSSGRLTSLLAGGATTEDEGGLNPAGAYCDRKQQGPDSGCLRNRKA